MDQRGVLPSLTRIRTLQKEEDINLGLSGVRAGMSRAGLLGGGDNKDYGCQFSFSAAVERTQRDGNLR